MKTYPDNAARNRPRVLPDGSYSHDTNHMSDGARTTRGITMKFPAELCNIGYGSWPGEGDGESRQAKEDEGSGNGEKKDDKENGGVCDEKIKTRLVGGVDVIWERGFCCGEGEDGVGAGSRRARLGPLHLVLGLDV